MSYNLVQQAYTRLELMGSVNCVRLTLAGSHRNWIRPLPSWKETGLFVHTSETWQRFTSFYPRTDRISSLSVVKNTP
ncbi:unnamed protein product [Dicrocoelium dendriticum]|nr:unnamed protein product [Dicrocoelium dendriticum]